MESEADILPDENVPEGTWHTATAEAPDAGTRVDKWLAGWTELSRARIGALIEAKQVRADGNIITKPTNKVREGIEYAVFVPPPVDDTPKPENIPLDILYEDDQLIVVNKPAGMLVHRSWLDKHETQFVMQTLRDQIGQHVFPLHRLDRPTSGVLIFALSSEIASQVMPMFANHDMQKTYHAIVRGWIEEGARLDYALKVEKDKIADKFATAEKEAQEAITDYRPLAKVELPLSTGRFPTSRYCLMELQPLTGRKHQLRRHMKHISHHILGDTKYGRGEHNKMVRQHYDCHRLMLHSHLMVLKHPYSGEEMVLSADVDEIFSAFLNIFEYSLDVLLDQHIQ